MRAPSIVLASLEDFPDWLETADCDDGVTRRHGRIRSLTCL